MASVPLCPSRPFSATPLQCLRFHPTSMILPARLQNFFTGPHFHHPIYTFIRSRACSRSRPPMRVISAGPGAESQCDSQCRHLDVRFNERLEVFIMKDLHLRTADKHEKGNGVVGGGVALSEFQMSGYGAWIKVATSVCRNWVVRGASMKT